MKEVAKIAPEEVVSQAAGGITLCERGLIFSDDTTFEAWYRKGRDFSRALNVVHNYIRWWVGDWILYGESRWPDKYTQGLDEHLYEIGTLRNAVYVCRNVPIQNRNPNLSFEHHYQVACLPLEAQVDALARAELHHWTVRQLRAYVRHIRGLGDSGTRRALKPAGSSRHAGAGAGTAEGANAAESQKVAEGANAAEGANTAAGADAAEGANAAEGAGVLAGGGGYEPPRDPCVPDKMVVRSVKSGEGGGLGVVVRGFEEWFSVYGSSFETPRELAEAAWLSGVDYYKKTLRDGVFEVVEPEN